MPPSVSISNESPRKTCSGLQPPQARWFHTKRRIALDHPTQPSQTNTRRRRNRLRCRRSDASRRHRRLRPYRLRRRLAGRRTRSGKRGRPRQPHEGLRHLGNDLDRPGQPQRSGPDIPHPGPGRAGHRRSPRQHGSRRRAMSSTAANSRQAGKRGLFTSRQGYGVPDYLPRRERRDPSRRAHRGYRRGLGTWTGHPRSGSDRRFLCRSVGSGRLNGAISETTTIPTFSARSTRPWPASGTRDARPAP